MDDELTIFRRCLAELFALRDAMRLNAGRPSAEQIAARLDDVGRRLSAFLPVEDVPEQAATPDVPSAPEQLAAYQAGQAAPVIDDEVVLPSVGEDDQPHGDQEAAGATGEDGARGAGESGGLS